MSPPSPPLRVQVLSGDPLARSGLELLLGRFALEVVTADAQVLLWDRGGRGEVRLPRGSADVAVLALVTEPADARVALSRGASGVLLRDAAPERLVAALHAVAADLVVLDDMLATEVLPASEDARTEPLTRREEEVLGLMAEGYSNADIGQALDLSAHTARFHVRAVLAKLGARNRAEAVARAARLGLLAY